MYLDLGCPRETVEELQAKLKLFQIGILSYLFSILSALEIDELL